MLTRNKIFLMGVLIITGLALFDIVSSLLYIDGETIVFNRNGKQVEINIVAIVNGTELEIVDNIDWWKVKIDNRTWKFGGNVTIPDTPTGGFIANNLEEIVFVVHTENVTI